MTQKPASEETIHRLYENMGNNFSLYVPILCSCVSSLESLEDIDEKEYKCIKEFKLWKIFIRLYVFSLLMDLDLSTFLRANFRTMLVPEKRFNLKYINVITLEGYKYLFGFGKDKDNAIWAKFKILAKEINDSELLTDINKIEQQAKEFENSYALSTDKDTRNLSIHYDLYPQKVYDFLIQIGEDTETNRINAFLKIIKDILPFLHKYILKFQIPLIYSTDNYNIDVREKINYFPDGNNKLFNELGAQITLYSNNLDSIVSNCKKTKIVQDKFKLGETFEGRLQTIVKSIYLGVHIHFIYLDLASAIRAYLSSEYYFEKQLNLRRINIIVYEGFNHIYGYTDIEQSKSFWKQNIYSILISSTDKNLTDLLVKIERELKELAVSDDINNMQLRECSVHYRFKDRDNTLTLFNALVKTNPLIEMNKAMKLLKILPELINLNTNSISVVNSTELEKIKLSNADTIEKIDSCLMMIEQANVDPELKLKTIETINAIKKLL
ncbi:MAG TPA: hypothetical protein DD434_10810 [Bacteroidales bacterium]|nr:hypothetical protein [Bacteroidales bacterium]